MSSQNRLRVEDALEKGLNFLGLGRVPEESVEEEVEELEEKEIHFGDTFTVMYDPDSPAETTCAYRSIPKIYLSWLRCSHRVMLCERHQLVSYFQSTGASSQICTTHESSIGPVAPVAPRLETIVWARRRCDEKQGDGAG